MSFKPAALLCLSGSTIQASPKACFWGGFGVRPLIECPVPDGVFRENWSAHRLFLPDTPGGTTTGTLRACRRLCTFSLPRLLHCPRQKRHQLVAANPRPVILRTHPGFGPQTAILPHEVDDPFSVLFIIRLLRRNIPLMRSKLYSFYRIELGLPLFYAACRQLARSFFCCSSHSFKT